MYLARSWSSNRSQSDCPVHSHTDLLGLGIIITVPFISDGATESGKKPVVTDLGGALSRFFNFGFRASAWITTLCHLVACSQKSCFPKESKKKKKKKRHHETDEGWNYLKSHTQGTNLINISTSKFVKHSHKRILRQDILHFHTTTLLWLHPLSPGWCLKLKQSVIRWSHARSTPRQTQPVASLVTRYVFSRSQVVPLRVS